MKKQIRYNTTREPFRPRSGAKIGPKSPNETRGEASERETHFSPFFK